MDDDYGYPYFRKPPYHKLQLLRVGLTPRSSWSSHARGEYWCLCKGADNIMGLEPQMLWRSVGYRPRFGHWSRKTPEAFMWSTFGRFPWVKSHPLLQAGSTNACGTPGLPLQLQNCCSFQQGVLQTCRGCRWGQAQTPDLTLLSTVARSQIASKMLNDHEFVEDWLARWKEATVAEVLTSCFISSCVQ